MFYRLTTSASIAVRLIFSVGALGALTSSARAEDNAAMQRASLQESLGKLPDDAALAFTAAVGGNPDIYLLTNDKVQQLTVGEARDEFPSWAPDGRQIAFHSKRDGNFDIYVMDSDGGNVRRLTLDKGFDGYPAWSPDGKVIAFQSSRGTPGSDTPLETYLMNADGTNVRKLVPRTSAVPPSARMASWSPDGSRVVVEASAPFILNDKRELVRNAKDGLYTVSVNGADSHQLSSWNAVDSCPAWSPDGNQIAFASTRANTIKLSLQTTQIFVMDIDGSNIRQLTNTRGQSLCPGWSPDGKKIAFYSDVGEAQIPTHAIYVMSAEGSGLTRITSTQVDAYFPTWRPLKK